ncbi:MAG: hypothetical protein ABIS74_16610 [Ferruginibacter sp.]
MRYNKFFSAAIVLCMIAFFTMGWKSSPTTLSFTKAPITIFINGGNAAPFTTSGAFVTEGTRFMPVRHSGKSNAGAIHCTNIFETSDGTGTFTILSNCQFTTSTGTWRVVSGTGAYANLRGNGQLVMANGTETMTGVVF